LRTGDTGRLLEVFSTASKIDFPSTAFAANSSSAVNRRKIARIFIERSHQQPGGGGAPQEAPESHAWISRGFRSAVRPRHPMLTVKMAAL
jgi:hypothetical protein